MNGNALALEACVPSRLLALVVFSLWSCAACASQSTASADTATVDPSGECSGQWEARVTNYTEVQITVYRVRLGVESFVGDVDPGSSQSFRFIGESAPTIVVRDRDRWLAYATARRPKLTGNVTIAFACVPS